MDRFSKLAVLAWVVAALVAEFYFVAGAWPAVRWLGPLLFLAAVAGAWFDRRSVALVLAPAYLVPILLFLAFGRYNALVSVVWLAPLAGITVPDALTRGWQLPERWRVPLVCWVGGVCATTPIVVARAVDFRWELLFRGRLPYEALGGLPLLTVAWTLHVALLFAVGLLWFDWLCGVDEPFFTRWIAAPLAAGVLVLAAVACYQLFVDVEFLNYSVYAKFRRASATMLDGNVAGALAALWIAGWAALGSTAASRRRKLLVLLALLMWLPVWATGSRTAFASAALITLACVPPFVPERFRTRRRVLIAATVVLVCGAAAVTVLARSTSLSASGPIKRIMKTMPEPTADGVRTLLSEMWNRNRYGLAATNAIERYPLFGIGVGAFHEMASEFLSRPLTPDNAQNWYRHQLVELGIVGSLGWLVFLSLFGWWVLRRHDGERPAAWCTRGVVLGIGAVSMLGMPGQDPFVAITLATFAAWHLLLAGRPAPAAPARWPAWSLGLVVIAAFTAGTLQQATGRLRLPVRLASQDVPYTYGFWPAEPDGRGGDVRWARQRATATVPVEGRVFELTLHANSDMLARPLGVRASVDGKVIIDTALTTSAPTITKQVLVPAGHPRVVVDTWAERAVTLPLPDGRDVAMQVGWRGASTAELVTP